MSPQGRCVARGGHRRGRAGAPDAVPNRFEDSRLGVLSGHRKCGTRPAVCPARAIFSRVEVDAMTRASRFLVALLAVTLLAAVAGAGPPVAPDIATPRPYEPLEHPMAYADH